MLHLRIGGALQTEQMISEKDDNRGYLSERVHTLQQRLEQSQLSGDERVTALQKEVNLLLQ